ncbi:Hypothetical predicted protein [Octopus vulgaris]|uniref:Uncharacterized protein n=1 Tax=Octopus vulgaris TaxID=6645 RepID=A0AA36BE27_OCTVU|nr:Hypothetical predicted protein [Octopus vulgaris]
MLTLPHPAVTSGVYKDDQMILVPEQFNKLSTSSHTDSGHGWSEGENGHYEELPGQTSCQSSEKQQNIGEKSIAPTLNRPTKYISTGTLARCAYQPNVGQVIQPTDVIDLKSVQVTNNSPNTSSQPWNLPSKNSFTTYSKPLPALPRIPPSQDFR